MSAGAARFIVAQLGARMHYAVPILLHDAGRLTYLATDFCAPGWATRAAEFTPGPLRALAQKAAGRRPALPRRAVQSFNAFGLRYAALLRLAKTQEAAARVNLWAGQRLCHLLSARTWSDANGIYVFNTAGLEALQMARQRGLVGVLEQTIAPRQVEDRLLDEQHRRFPQWESRQEHRSNAALAARERAEWDAADIVICGSEFVKQGIAECGGPVERCVVVPYGVNTSAIGPRTTHAADGRLRVLTVGQVGLRKGSPYVLEAARALAGKVDFTMAGPFAHLNARVLGELREAGIALTGPVPRSKMNELYARADVLLLPSLCEGSSTATYEALAAGLPVICTANTGSVVRHGVEGFIIPTGESASIVHSLTTLDQNRTLLADLQRRALERSRQFDLASYGRRLMAALDGIPERR